jgi:phosphoribosylformylglycinamidine synthase PurS subunit
MNFSVHVEVRGLPGIADPEGRTIERALPALGFTGVSSVRVGKVIAFDLEADRRGCSPQRGPRRCVPAALQSGDPARRSVDSRPHERTRRGRLLSRFELRARRRRGARRASGPRPRSSGTRRAARRLHAVVVPGGFAHGDYIRPGAIAQFSPVMAPVAGPPRRAIRCSGSATASRCSSRPGCCRGADAKRRSPLPLRDGDL